MVRVQSRRLPVILAFVSLVGGACAPARPPEATASREPPLSTSHAEPRRQDHDGTAITEEDRAEAHEAEADKQLIRDTFTENGVPPDPRFVDLMHEIYQSQGYSPRRQPDCDVLTDNQYGYQKSPVLGPGCIVCPKPVELPLCEGESEASPMPSHAPRYPASGVVEWSVTLGVGWGICMGAPRKCGCSRKCRGIFGILSPMLSESAGPPPAGTWVLAVRFEEQLLSSVRAALPSTYYDDEGLLYSNSDESATCLPFALDRSNLKTSVRITGRVLPGTVPMTEETHYFAATAICREGPSDTPKAAPSPAGQ